MKEIVKDNPSNKVLVIGGGVGGIKASLDLAEAGRDVVLIDKAYSIGGLMTQLDRTFPTNNCDLCTLSPSLAEGSRSRHIELLPLTRLESIDGVAGRFNVSLKINPRFIDLNKCTACGECHNKFPQWVRFTPGLDHRAPTCMRYPQATPYAFSIDMDQCDDIRKIEEVCPAGAIVPDDREQTKEMEVGALILAPGADLINPEGLINYGYGAYPNVVTALEYERILSSSGPTGGILACPSNGSQPKKIAWIQCAGSRSNQNNNLPYCSSVCCMYALKEAIVTKERFQDDIEATIFFMDMRTVGKDYEQYLKRAKENFGVRFERCRPHSVEPVAGTDDLSIAYLTDESGVSKREAFDMIVLSTGFKIDRDGMALSTALGIDLNRHNFARTDSFHPVETSRKGIYVCGIFESPKDIPETMVQASAAACLAAGDLKHIKYRTEDESELIPERDLSDEDKNIGVFVCDCGSNIGGVINVDALMEYSKNLPNVNVSENIGHGCSKKSLIRIKKLIKEKHLNRIVIGGCSPKTHENLFREVIREAGINRYMIEMANIRDQATWVHADQPKKAFNKTKDLIRMAVSSVSLTHPLKDQTISINTGVLVVGGGVSGMNTALCLADQGYKVYLVEKSKQLGGVAGNIKKTIAGEDVDSYVRDLIERTTHHDRIQVMTRAIIVDHYGLPGLFTTGLQTWPRMDYRQIKHGVTILATGALAHRPKEYLLDEHDAVMTQMDLDGVLEEQRSRVEHWKRIVMIQCVGSRTSQNPNCSRICCQSAIKNALRIRKINPDAQIIILYRDMRTYGLLEDYYQKAKEENIIFSRYSEDCKPEVHIDGDRVIVNFRDPILESEVKISVDCLALSTGMIADDEDTEDLAAIFHLQRTPDGYFLEDHTKLRPVDLTVPGFFLAGTAHAPKSIKESIAQAQAAAGRAQTLLSKQKINLGASVARVDGNKCASCLICVRACPFDVPFINADGYSEIDPAKCHGCGVCAAECPAKAIQLTQFEDDRILSSLSGLFEEVI